MAISYNGLWKQLIDHGMKKMPLTHQCVHLCSPQHQSDRKDWIFIIIVV